MKNQPEISSLNFSVQHCFCFCQRMCLKPKYSSSSTSLSRSIGAVKSASAYNLVRMRKKSSIFKSFDTELDPVSEIDNQHLIPETSSAMCQSTYSNDEDVTISEEVITAATSPPLSPRKGSLQCSESTPRSRDSVIRMSRHRPLQFAMDSSSPPPALAIFQVNPTASVG
ncbi:hypothetical protein B9Z55_028407 [Caenorhabditis nigoni]|nr:hypothetical protein B9Z55_028407 [Caenorhabditis nigoni]